jgi:hypothetical protein
VTKQDSRGYESGRQADAQKDLVRGELVREVAAVLGAWERGEVETTATPLAERLVSLVQDAPRSART